MVEKKVRIKLKGYDHQVLDKSVAKIIQTAESTGVKVKGPIVLPTRKNIITILRATHKYKDSREQFEMRTHKRILDIIDPTPKTMDSLTRIKLPSGVDIQIKL